MTRRLSREELVTIPVLKEKGQANTQIAQILGVTEGAVQHHVRRQGREDGRKQKPTMAVAIDAGMREGQPDDGSTRRAHQRA
jgi:hypothetical protein